MREVLSRSSIVRQSARRRTFLKVIWFLLGLIALYIGLGLLSHIPRYRINEIEIVGTKILDDDAVSAKTLEYLSKNTGIFYARGNVFIFSKDKIVDFIKKEFPRVWQVDSVERTNQKLTVNIEEREGAYLWCGQNLPVYAERFSKKNCFFIDQEGFVFDEAPYFTDGVYLEVFGGIENPDSPIGQIIRTQNSMESIKTFIEALREEGLPIHSLVISADGQHEFLLDIVTTTGDYAKILFNETESLSDIFTKIRSAIKEEAFAEEFGEKKQTLQYIDTRFKGRVFYNFQDGQ